MGQEDLISFDMFSYKGDFLEALNKQNPKNICLHLKRLAIRRLLNQKYKIKSEKTDWFMFHKVSF